MPKSPILGGFSTQRSRSAADNTLVNLGLEIIESKDGKVPGFLFLQSGLDLAYIVGSGPIRGILPLNGVLYVVSGENVYSLTSTGTQEFLGTVTNAASLVSMFENGRQLMIVDGVGGWIVPGGFPLVSGVVTNGGGLYAIGDTITLRPDGSGSQSAFPIVTVTAVSNTPVTSYYLPNLGTTYFTQSNVATFNIQPQPGLGTGLTIDIFTVFEGIVDGWGINQPGTGYAIGDTGYLLDGNRGAIYLVWSVGGGGSVTRVLVINGGFGYTVTSDVSTATGTFPFNFGTGLTFNIVAPGGPISSSTIASGGTGFAVGNTGYLLGGTVDATYEVLSIGLNGSVVSFNITQAGAVFSPTAGSFVQQSTSGSGSGFVLGSPAYGGFVSLVPVTLPFPNPVVGGISDGFGVLVFQNQQYLAASDELDLSTWDALSFGVADQSPDNCVSLAVIHDEVFVLKEGNTEVWIDEGNANFPFGPITSVHIEWGIAAPFSAAIVGNNLIWLSANAQGQGIVVMADGYKPTPISTQALVAQFDTYPTLGDAIAYARQEGQHVYYVLTFPEANATWQFDVTASEHVGYPIWAQLGAFSQGALSRHWGNVFTVWKGAGQAAPVTTTYQAQSVQMTSGTRLQSTGLNGLPQFFSSFVFSVWLYIPDSAAAEMIFSNQNDDTHGSYNPGVFIEIQNNATGSPQIIITLLDANDAVIVTAEYNFASWSGWVNLLISVDTAIQAIQVFATSLVGASLIEELLPPVVLGWASANPIFSSSSQSWHLAALA